ncbi:hypothetical protein J2Y55_003161 [Bosea sp. BE125]|nr:hypothetical protein [Bosea sp. BE125]
MSREREERFAEPGRGFRGASGGKGARGARFRSGPASLCLRL